MHSPTSTRRPTGPVFCSRHAGCRDERRRAVAVVKETTVAMVAVVKEEAAVVKEEAAVVKEEAVRAAAEAAAKERLSSAAALRPA
eukprot:scaffold54857_cov30-Phaeocystis_antarctica.AAC.1